MSRWPRVAARGRVVPVPGVCPRAVGPRAVGPDRPGAAVRELWAAEAEKPRWQAKEEDRNLACRSPRRASTRQANSNPPTCPLTAVTSVCSIQRAVSRWQAGFRSNRNAAARARGAPGCGARRRRNGPETARWPAETAGPAEATAERSRAEFARANRPTHARRRRRRCRVHGWRSCAGVSADTLGTCERAGKQPVIGHQKLDTDESTGLVEIKRHVVKRRERQCVPRIHLADGRMLGSPRTQASVPGDPVMRGGTHGPQLPRRPR